MRDSLNKLAFHGLDLSRLAVENLLKRSGRPFTS